MSDEKESSEAQARLRLEQMRTSMPWHKFLNACKADDTMPNKIVNEAMLDMAKAVNPLELEELAKRSDSGKDVHAAIRIVRELTKPANPPQGQQGGQNPQGQQGQQGQQNPQGQQGQGQPAR